MDYSKFSTATLAKIASGQKPDYANMSEEELKEIASHQEKQAEQLKEEPKKEISAPKAALLGAQQGVTAGFADEIGGGIQRLANAVQGVAHNVAPKLVNESPTQMSAKLKAQGFTGDVGPSDYSEFYRQARDENRKESHQASEEHPYAYTAGEIAGGVLGAKGAGMAAKGAGVAIPTLVEAPEGKGLVKAVQRIGAHAVNAAPIGALYGLGGSEAELGSGKAEDIKKGIKDTATGALTGSLAGAALHTAAEGIGSAVSSAKSSRTASRLGQGYKDTASGIDPTNVEHQVGSIGETAAPTETPVAMRPSEAATAVVRTIDKMDTHLGQNVEKAAIEATNQGTKIATSQDLRESLNSLNAMATKDPVLAESPAFKKLQDNIKTFRGDSIDPATGQPIEGSGELTPIQAHYLKQEMGDLGYQLQDSSPQISKEAFKVADQVRQELGKQVPTYNTAAIRQNEFRTLLPEQFLNKGNDVDVYGMRVSGTKNYQRKMQDNLLNVIQNADQQGDPNSSAKRTLAGFINGMKQFELNEHNRVSDRHIKSTLFDDAGIRPEDFESHIKDAARESNNTRQLAGETRIAPGGGSLGKAVEYTKAAADKVAMKAGEVSRDLGFKTNPVVNTSTRLYQATDPELDIFADKLQKVPGQGQMATSLKNAVKNKDSATKNAILFAILQNPALRNLANPSDSGR